MSEWFSVNDRLPEDQEECLVAFRCKPNFAYEMATYSTEDKRFISWNNLKMNVSNGYWMPLPTPPEVENE